MTKLLVPERLTNHQGDERRVGVEIEFADVEPHRVLALITELYGGEAIQNTGFEFTVKDTCWGKFVLELDASYLKDIGRRLHPGEQNWDDYSIETLASEFLARTAEQIVPWEIVTPPVPMSELHKLLALVEKLREAGALGTRHTFRYAFGVHLNPELPNLEVDTIRNYFRAYLCLYDWIVEQEQVDLTRRLTTYIKHFDKDYILETINPNKAPDLRQFIVSYLLDNPTRNRSMDLLPLFNYLMPELVERYVDDERVNKRPTFHYRLPNCDIDNPNWNIDKPWLAWLEVERLANNPAKLDTICIAYAEYLDNFLPDFNHHWVGRCQQWIDAK